MQRLGKRVVLALEGGPWLVLHAARPRGRRRQGSGGHDLRQLKEAMLLQIANDATLGPEWLDRPLKGQWADHCECHIGGDFLLIYRADKDAITFARAGSHTELFGR